jgi:hypothetical protein
MDQRKNDGIEKLKKDIHYLWKIHRDRLSAVELASELRMRRMWPLSLSVEEVETAIASLEMNELVSR